MLYVGLICAFLFVRKSKLSFFLRCGAAPLGVWCPITQQQCFASQVNEVLEKQLLSFFCSQNSNFIAIVCPLEFCCKEE
jgi:hypothetical protein